MTSDSDLVAFLREHVRSAWAVELLLLLKRDPTRCWEPDELVRELRASRTLVLDITQRFQRSGLVVLDDKGCHRYGPASPLLADLCMRLEAAYRERPVSIINTMMRPPDPVQGLADAFKFRGDGK